MAGVLVVLAFVVFLIEGASAATFTLTNNCQYTVWPGLLSSAGTASLPTTGFALQSGESRSLDAPAAWSGRLWGRTHCSTDSTGKFSCGSGDCGSGSVECSGGGAAPPATLAEFTLAGSGGMDFYDVSLVDGYNLPMLVVPEGGSGGTCSSTGCLVDLNALCPSDLKVVLAHSGGASGCSASAVAGVKRSFIRSLPSLPKRGPPPFLLLPRSTGALVRRRFLFTVAARDSNPQQQQQQEINISILRFTFGIPGLDESYLPRYLGIALGTLIVINHVFSAAPATPAQLRTEALGIFLAAFSIVLPYLGRFLEGAKVDRTSLPEGNRQIFLMSDNISDDLKEDLAWASYALLRSTNSISVIIAVNDVLCIRGYWNMPENEDDSRDHLFQWFGNGIQQSGFFDLKETLYFPESLGSELRIPLPKGTLSMLVQPIIRVSDAVTNSIPPLENEGFLLVASNVRYAYSKKDRAWIKAVANKFLHTSEVKNAQGFVTSL